MRRFCLECTACDSPRFRTSPLLVGDDTESLPGINAASVQLAEHAYEAHGNSDGVRFASVDLPEDMGSAGPSIGASGEE